MSPTGIERRRTPRQESMIENYMTIVFNIMRRNAPEKMVPIKSAIITVAPEVKQLEEQVA